MSPLITAASLFLWITVFAGGIKWNIIVRKWEIVVNTRAMLIGEFTHAIDDKNRISLPSKFRQELGKKVVVTPGLDGCLFVFTLKRWNELSEQLGKASMLQADARGFNRYMFGGASEAEVDSVGRILVPEFLKLHAGLRGTVSIIGVQDRLEIWNEKTWSEYKRVVEKRADTLAEKLGTIGVL